MSKAAKHRPHLTSAEMAVQDLARTVGVDKAREVLQQLAVGFDGRSFHPVTVPTDALLDVPDSVAKELPPFVLPNTQKWTVLILPDVHAPAHDKENLIQAVRYGVAHGCNALCLLGDAVDNYSLSRYRKNPHALRFTQEMEIASRLFKAIGECHQWQLKIYKVGNHCERLDHYLIDNAPQMFQEEGMALRHWLKLDELSYTLVLGQQHIWAGKCTLIHGHEIKAGGSVNPARNKMLRAYDNIVFGHHHTTGNSPIRTIRGKEMNAWAVGGLFSLAQEYALTNQFIQGFAILEVETDGSFTMHNKRFIDGKIHSV
jgi:predicted phosphodiesterase